MEHSYVDSKTLGKDPNLSFGILIQKLPKKLMTDAIKSLEEGIGILPSSVVRMTLSKLGVNVVFDKYEPFYKAVTTRRLFVQSKMFPMYPMLTDLTVVGAAPYLAQNTIKSLMAEIAPVWSVYPEIDSKTGPTTNYRVIMHHPEIPDDIKLWPLLNLNRIIGNNTTYPIKFFCRLCRKNGHTRYQCKVTAQQCDEKLEEKRKMEEERRKLKEERRKLEEESRKLEEERRKLEEEKRILEERRNLGEIQKLEERGKVMEIIKIKKEANCSDGPKTLKVVKPRLTKAKKVTFSKLIPPEFRNSNKCLKEFLFNARKEDSDKLLHDKATLYPYGIDVLLQHLYEIVQFNLKVMSSKNPPERALIIWIDSLQTKIKGEHLKNTIIKEEHLKNTIMKEEHLKNTISKEEHLKNTIIKDEPISYDELNDVDSYGQKSVPLEPCRARRNHKTENLERVIKSIKVDKDRCHAKEVIHNKSRKKHHPNAEMIKDKSKNTNVNQQIDDLNKDSTEKCYEGKEMLPDTLKVSEQKRKKCYLDRKVSSDRTNSANKDTFKKKKLRTKNGVSERSAESSAQEVQNTNVTQSVCSSIYVSCNPKEGFVMQNQSYVEVTSDGKSIHDNNVLNTVAKEDAHQIREPKRCSAQNDKIIEAGHIVANHISYEVGEQMRQRYNLKQQVSSKRTAFHKSASNKILKNSDHVKTIWDNHCSKTGENASDEMFKQHHLMNNSAAKIVYDNHCPKTANQTSVETSNDDFMKKHSESVHLKDENGINTTQERLYQEIKAEVKPVITVPKDFSSTTTTAKPRTKKPNAARKPSEKFSPGLSAAIRCSKGVLKYTELKAFLTHVRGKIHVRKMAKNYTPNVQGLIEQLEVIVRKHFQALKVNSATNREIKWIRELIERLKSHANCESCNT